MAIKLKQSQTINSLHNALIQGFTFRGILPEISGKCFKPVKNFGFRACTRRNDLPCAPYLVFQVFVPYWSRGTKALGTRLLAPPNHCTAMVPKVFSLLSYI